MRAAEFVGAVLMGVAFAAVLFAGPVLVFAVGVLAAITVGLWLLGRYQRAVDANFNADEAAWESLPGPLGDLAWDEHEAGEVRR